MRRLHLFEFEDQPWLPAAWRDLGTDFLRDAIVLGMGFYDRAAPLIARVLQATGERRIVDLCSGGSGPWISLKGLVEQECGPVTLVLTDRFPNLAAFEHAAATIGDGRTTHRVDPVDVTDVPADLVGVRTVFTGLHHLRPEQARAVLVDAFGTRTAICVFEHTERSVAAVGAALLAPLLIAYRSARFRPLSWRRLALTYLLPMLPDLGTWDTLVSNLRTYSVAELDELVRPLVREDWRWEIGRLPGTGGPPLTYLLGHPIAP